MNLIGINAPSTNLITDQVHKIQIASIFYFLFAFNNLILKTSPLMFVLAMFLLNQAFGHQVSSIKISCCHKNPPTFQRLQEKFLISTPIK